jgi:hypothetical protein
VPPALRALREVLPSTATAVNRSRTSALLEQSRPLAQGFVASLSSWGLITEIPVLQLPKTTTRKNACNFAAGVSYGHIGNRNIDINVYHKSLMHQKRCPSVSAAGRPENADLPRSMGRTCW